LAAVAASRASAWARAGAAATAFAFGTNNAGWENSTGAASSGEMITRIPIRVLSNNFFEGDLSLVAPTWPALSGAKRTDLAGKTVGSIETPLRD
jgi:hypothetical protein